MPNVLVFESDGSFAGELKGELERRGCSVTVVDDASVGLQTAASDRPDLILLTIELPRMNGFSVCNKLKRDPALKEVPLIIMSSDSTEETFEQHRRLRTHAEDYVHKPISFIELLPRITAHVPLADGTGDGASNGESNGEGLDDVVIDAVDFDEAEVLAASIPPPPVEAVPVGGVDDEVDAFTENAFGSLMEEEREDPVAAALQAVPSSPIALPFPESEPAPAESGGGIDLDSVSLPPAEDLPMPPIAAVEDARPPVRTMSSIPPRPRIEPVDTALREELARQAERASDLERELRSAKTRVAELEDETARAATKDAEVQRLLRELDETKAKAAASVGAGKGGGSAREFLDLREALNRKDKEILDLRDSITHREKDLLGLRDTNLGVEREKADLQDKLEGLEKAANDAGRLLEVAKADKDQASKRADDFKRKIEKLQSELDAKAAEFDDVKRRADESAATREGAESALRAEIESTRAHLTSELETTRTTLLAELESTKSSLGAELETTRNALGSDLDNARAAHRTELDETRAQAERDKTAAAEEAARLAREEGERNASLAVAEVNERATRDRDQAIQARELDLRREQDAKLAALHRANEESLNRIRAEHSQGIDDEKKAGADALADQESRYAREHEAVVKTHEAAHEVTKRELGDISSTLETVRREKDESLAERDGRINALTSDLSQRTSELEAVKRTLEERSAELDAARATLAATHQDLSEVETSLSNEQGKTSRAATKWADDRASLERAKDALAAALAQLDEIEARPLD